MAKETVEKVVINPIADDFGREDLNKLRDAVNALIAKVD